MKRDHDLIPLRDAIREHYSRDQLSPAELAGLRQLAGGTPASSSRRRWLAAAAAVSGAAVLGYWGADKLPRHDNAQQLADEVAYAHLAASPLDIVTDDLQVLRTAFTPLGFSLLDAQQIENVPGELIGGRFCSVASVPAALLRYRSGHGDISVFQARFDPERHRGAGDRSAEQAVIRHARGVAVCLCNVHGVLLVEAASAGPAVA